MNLREEPIRSQKYLRGAKGSSCKFMAPGICCGNDETTVFAHLNGDAFGKAKGRKAHDIAGLDACFACHTYIDIGHGHKPLMSDAEFHWLLLRGVVLTMVDRARRKIIIVPLDPERLLNDRPAKPRKPPAERKAIPARVDAWPEGRKLQSRNDLSRPRSNHRTRTP